MASSQIKYIGTKDAVRLTGLSTQEIYDLIHSGKLPARKAPKSGWRILSQDLETLGLIKTEIDSSNLKHSWKRFTKIAKEFDRFIKER